MNWKSVTVAFKVVNFFVSYADAPWCAKIGVETPSSPAAKANKVMALHFMEHLLNWPEYPIAVRDVSMPKLRDREVRFSDAESPASEQGLSHKQVDKPAILKTMRSSGREFTNLLAGRRLLVAPASRRRFLIQVNWRKNAGETPAPPCTPPIVTAVKLFLRDRLL